MRVIESKYIHNTVCFNIYVVYKLGFCTGYKLYG